MEHESTQLFVPLSWTWVVPVVATIVLFLALGVEAFARHWVCDFATPLARIGDEGILRRVASEEIDFVVHEHAMRRVEDRRLLAVHHAREGDSDFVEINFGVLHEDRWARHSAKSHRLLVHVDRFDLRVERSLADRAAVVAGRTAIRELQRVEVGR